MAPAVHSSGDDSLRRRVAVRLFAYGSVLVALVGVSLTGHLDRPGVPLGIAVIGMLLSLTFGRYPRAAFMAAAAYDSIAAVILSLVVGSWVAGGLAVVVAATMVTMSRPRTVVGPALVTAAVAAAALVAMEWGALPRPGLPLVEPPADLILAAAGAVMVTALGIDGIRRLTAGYASASTEAEEATSRWWDLVNSASRAMVVERDGLIAHANPAAAVLLGRAPDGLVGDVLDDVIRSHPDAHLEVVRSPVNLRGTPAVLTVVSDRSDVRDEHRRLEQLVQDKDRFLATVSHEVRTPLTAVVGLAAAIEEQWEELDAEEMRELVGLLVQQSQEMAMIIDDLTVAARSADAIPLAREVVSLSTQVDQVVAGLDLAGKQLVLGEDAKVVADAARTRQVIRNLLTNAVRYGGPTIRVSAERHGDRVRFHVDDDGPAIPEHLTEAIFQPYRQAHDDPRTAPDSMGLGLAVARQLAELMGGSLHHERLRAWNRFVLELPADDQ